MMEQIYNNYVNVLLTTIGSFVYIYSFFKFYAFYLNKKVNCILDEYVSQPISNQHIVEQQVVTRYEDKYLESVRKMDVCWNFTKEELIEIDQISLHFFNELVKPTKDRLLETPDLLETERIQLEKYLENNDLQFKSTSYEKATSDFLKIKLDKLQNSSVIEKTPAGNVLMMYDNSRETFKYYSDTTIPYRYLEVVARKYVKMFNCRPIYVDMEDELKKAEIITKDQQTKDQQTKDQQTKDQQTKDQQIKDQTDNIAKELIKPIEKKNVFAKFKSYNKDVGSKSSMCPPQKNTPSTMSSNTNLNKDNAIVNSNSNKDTSIVNAKANRYTCEGKMVNYNFLKKPEKKVFNKKLGMSFADFKKMKPL